MSKDLTIGQALKEERDILGISQQQFCGDIITRSAYAKVERGERQMRADALVRLLFKNNIDINYFFDKLKSHYQSDDDRRADELMKKMKKAFDNHQVEAVKNYKEKILNLNGHEILKIRAIIAAGYLTRQLKEISDTVSDRLFRELGKRENWFEDVEAIRLLTNAMPMLSDEQLDFYVGVILEKYDDRKDLSEKEQERLAIICDNFVLSSYERNIKSKNAKKALDYLLNLDKSPHLLVYRVSGMYDKALLTDDKKEKEKIRNFMCYCGYDEMIKNWK